jgi:hypothetical protein
MGFVRPKVSSLVRESNTYDPKKENLSPISNFESSFGDFTFKGEPPSRNLNLGAD